MSEELVKTVQGMLNEEKWTRAAITNYTQNHFKELANIVEKAQAENCIDEVKAVSDEHLANSKNSIIGLYFSGMLGLKKRTLDNSPLETLLNFFLDNHKTQIVTYLCERILDEDENNKFALHTLADCYREDNDARMWEIYEKIVKIDFEEADIAKLLAEREEKEGNIEGAVDYYKKALLRYINKKQLNQVKEMWNKLIALIPEEIDFFYMIQRKVAKSLGEEKSSLMMMELYNYYKNAEKWDIGLDILKLILSIDEKEGWARKELVDCYRGKYADHSQLEHCITISSLDSRYRNVFEAIADFEKHIAFDVENYVFHRSWGVGKIRKVENENITIYFGKKNGEHEMSLKMAVSALQPLAKNHIWVLKATKKKEVLHDKVKDDQEWTLKTIIRSFDNSCDFKRIKAEIVPSILSTTEWTSWSTKARKILDENEIFGVNPNDITQYTVRDRAITKEEKLSNEFKAQKQFYPRVDILMRFAEIDTENDLFSDMFSYFAGFLRSFSTITDQTLAAFLVVRRLVQEFPHLNTGIQLDIFDKLFAEIENPAEMYMKLKDTKSTYLREDFLSCIRMLPNWSDIYVKLFPTVLQDKMISQLVNGGYTDKVKKLAADSFENYRAYRLSAIYFFKECQDQDWFKEIGLSYEKQMIVLIHIMDVCFREIANHSDTTENRKIIRQVQLLLFKDNTLLNYILDHDEDTITRLYTLVDDVEDLDATVKMQMRNKILEKHPGFKFYGTEEKAVTPKGLIVTSKMYDAKKAELNQLITIEIPANSKEIGEALEKGDLRENAEYKAAKERQTQLNTRVTRLTEEIDRAQIFDPTTVTTAHISFGTKVSLFNTKEKKEEVFTILGPWESDPENGIISYMSPLGNAILNSKAGENLTFVINEVEYNFDVKKIEVAAI